MLQRMEVLEGGPRRELRRGVEVQCNVFSDWWDDAVSLDARDLSADGIWLQSALNLRPGDRVRVSFRPPNWRGGVPIVADGTVRRVDHRARKRWGTASGMGIEFKGLEPWEREALGEALTGLPPALPTDLGSVMVREQLYWVDELLADFDEASDVDDEIEATIEKLFDTDSRAIETLGVPLGPVDTESIPISLAA